MALQQKDAFIGSYREAEAKPNRRRSAGGSNWTFDDYRLLRYCGMTYIPPDSALRTELIKRHYNNILAGYFGVEKTLELVYRKYYWKGLPRDVK